MIRRKIKHISPELPQMLELADKNVKIVFITVLLKLRKEMKKYILKNQTPKDKNYSVIDDTLLDEIKCS